MSITRRKFLGLLPAVSAIFVPATSAAAKPESLSRTILGYRLHDDVSVSLLKRYSRSLALSDERVRWEAQMMFHEAQLARRQGGTIGHKLGYRHRDFVEAHEEGRPIDKSKPLWR